jgi:epoxyqueuosine reductase
MKEKEDLGETPGKAAVMTDWLLESASLVGLDQIGWTLVGPASDFSHFCDWLGNEMHGEMHYLEKHKEARRHPHSILPTASTLLMGLVNYQPADTPHFPGGPFGKVARYARGPDYHQVLWEKLGKLGEAIAQRVPECSWRAIADSAPLLERGFAQRCGLGWIGKNTLLIHRKLGSFSVLGGLLLSCVLPPMPMALEVPDSCGTCTRCLDACPTQAIGPARVLDARKCISYWTIEKRGALGESAGTNLNDWLFGCDICQEVCPWNRRSTPGRFLGQKNELAQIDCKRLLEMNDAELRSLIQGSALKRAKPSGLRRNALWILGKSGDKNDLILINGYTNSPEEGTREAAQWAEREIRLRMANQ